MTTRRLFAILIAFAVLLPSAGITTASGCTSDEFLSSFHEKIVASSDEERLALLDDLGDECEAAYIKWQSPAPGFEVLPTEVLEEPSSVTAQACRSILNAAVKYTVGGNVAYRVTSTMYYCNNLSTGVIVGTPSMNTYLWDIDALFYDRGYTNDYGHFSGPGRYQHQQTRMVENCVISWNCISAYYPAARFTVFGSTYNYGQYITAG